MIRVDIGNYLSLTVETYQSLARTLSKSGMLAVKGKYITIEYHALLSDLASTQQKIA